ncbi:MAG: hypothetical protein PHQ28_00025 [Mycobacterium sp.]|nr:hypothetical protein [Mycobacterium sp.]
MYVADINDAALLEEMAVRLLADVSVSAARREQAQWDLEDVRGRIAELEQD